MGVPLQPLFPGRVEEQWRDGPVVSRQRFAGGGCVATENNLLIHVTCPAAEIGPITRETYGAMLRRIIAAGYPHPVRAWNYIPGIHDGEGDGERYRQFNAGRAAAFAETGLAAAGYPAATAVGTPPGSPLIMALLASRSPPTGIENPRQTSAYHYPREFGPRAPAFARATLLPDAGGGVLLVSGTASIVGFSSRHSDVRAQLEEIIVNLELLLTTALASESGYEIGSLSGFRVYLRDPADAPFVDAELRRRLPGCDAPIILQADICRRELLVEIEGVYELDGAQG